MGNCLCSSQPAVDARPLVYGRFVSRERKVETASGRQVEFQAASWAARDPLEDSHCVHFSGDGIFIGVFDGIGGSEASRLCRAKAWPTFQSCLSSCQGDVSHALVDTVSGLDDLFFAETQDKAVKSYVGASVTLCWVNLVHDTVHLASHGTCFSSHGALQGAFSGQYVSGCLLPGANSEGQAQDEQRLQAEFPAASRPLFEEVEGRRLLLGLSPVTRAIGLGVLKHRDLAAWHNSSAGGQYKISTLPCPQTPYILNTPFTAEVRLELGEHPLVIGSGGLWQLLSPSAAAAWCYTRQSVPPWPLPEDIPEDGESGSEASPQAALPPNTADTLILQALCTAMSKQRGRGQILRTVDDLASIACTTVPELDEGPKGKRAVPQPSQTRLDFHDDLTCVILSTRQPSRSVIASHEDAPVGRRTGHARKTRAAHYWELCKAFHHYHVMRRRALVHRWLEVTDAACALHKRAAYDRARQAEVDAWRNEGKAIQVSNSGAINPVDVHFQ